MQYWSFSVVMYAYLIERKQILSNRQTWRAGKNHNYSDKWVSVLHSYKMPGCLKDFSPLLNSSSELVKSHGKFELEHFYFISHFKCYPILDVSQVRWAAEQMEMLDLVPPMKLDILVYFNCNFLWSFVDCRYFPEVNVFRPIGRINNVTPPPCTGCFHYE